MKTSDRDAAAEAVRIEAELGAFADPGYAKSMQGFFKTGPGGYGKGDVFIGLRVPQTRAVAKRHRDASLETCERQLSSEIHEHRFAALAILRHRFERDDRAERERVADLYLAHRERVDNWDLVDASAEYLLADRVLRVPRRLLDPLLRSESVFDRRIAVLATFALIKQGEFAQTLHLAEALLDDDHDLIQRDRQARRGTTSRLSRPPRDRDAADDAALLDRAVARA